MKLRFSHIIFLLFALFDFGKVKAQLNTDSMLVAASGLAAAGNYQACRDLTDTILTAIPTYTDAKLLYLRSYAWEKNFDKALSETENYLSLNPGNKEATELKSTILLWAGKHNENVSYTKQELKNFRNDIALKGSLAKSLYALEEWDSCEVVLLDWSLLDTANNEPKDLLEIVTLKAAKHLFGANFGGEFYTNFQDWRNTYSIDYLHRKRRNSYQVRLNYTTLLGNNDLQLESENFLKIKKKYTLYLTGAVAIGDIFPQYRLGIDFYIPLKKGFEVALGGRYLKFKSVTVPMIDGYLGYYLGKNWFALRSFWLFNRPYGTTNELSWRRFYKRELCFTELKLGLGSSPDNAFIAGIFSQSYQQNSAYAVLTGQYRFTKTAYVRGSLFYADQNFNSDRNYKIYGFNIGCWIWL